MVNQEWAQKVIRGCQYFFHFSHFFLIFAYYSIGKIYIYY